MKKLTDGSATERTKRTSTAASENGRDRHSKRRTTKETTTEDRARSSGGSQCPDNVSYRAVRCFPAGGPLGGRGEPMNTDRLTDATLMQAVYDRRGSTVRVKTLSELDGLGRPNVGELRALANGLIHAGYLAAAGYTRDEQLKAVVCTEKLHEGAAALLKQRADENAQTNAAKDAKRGLQEELADSSLIDRAVAEARCAWTQDEPERYQRVTEKLTTWVETTFGANPPRDVTRRIRRTQDRCDCWNCREVSLGLAENAGVDALGFGDKSELNEWHGLTEPAQRHGQEVPQSSSIPQPEISQ